MKSLTHHHVTEQIEKKGVLLREGSGRSIYAFAVHLKDGTFLPCVKSYCGEWDVRDVKNSEGIIEKHFDARSRGSFAYAYSIVQADHVQSVSPSSFLIGPELRDALLKAEYRDFYQLRIRMKDSREFTLVAEGELSFFRPPEGCSWNDVVEWTPGFDKNPKTKIFPMISFYCIVYGLSIADQGRSNGIG